MSPDDVKGSKYQDKFNTVVKKKTPAGEPAMIQESGVISSDTLMKDKDLRGGLQDLISRFSKGMKG